MHVVAFKPTVPARIPFHASYVGLGGRTVRLEAPDELPGTWESPVYATLIGEPQLRAEAPSTTLTTHHAGPSRACHGAILDPALASDADFPQAGKRAPGASAAVRLSFIRFTLHFVASPRDNTKFTKHTSDVFLCGQVLAYQPASSIALVDDIDLLQEPGCGYTLHGSRLRLRWGAPPGGRRPADRRSKPSYLTR
ncbi:hypothetical protein PHYPSEUDO_014207 [Phytophthora pseudosyringae]|uniref:Uncharacterized protein n=1 Tax=Phytophthora pseudosyringae TaxID=221518 RepID=A0A8T1V7T9_9STRA|nr:hypothetical protein PHYPSEUDO_014207 [Phytophthora pseudosyringae]